MRNYVNHQQIHRAMLIARVKNASEIVRQALLAQVASKDPERKFTAFFFCILKKMTKKKKPSNMNLFRIDAMNQHDTGIHGTKLL